MAAETVNVEELEKKITCFICHDYFSNPKVLPCCHYYCKQCIHNLALRAGINRPFSCPECCKTTSLPEGAADNLPTAFFINRMKVMYFNIQRAQGKVQTKCLMCSRNKAEAFCMQCAMFICAECIKQHRIMKVFSGHKTSTLDDLKEYDILPKPTLPICELHEEPLKFFCYHCKCLICRDCTVENHRDHKFQSIKVAISDTKKKLIRKLDPLKNAQERLMQAITEIQTAESEVETQGNFMPEMINQAFDELETLIRNRRHEVMREAAVNVSHKLERLSVQKKGLYISSAAIQSVIDYTENCVEHSADDEVMSMYPEIQRQIESVIEEQQKEGKEMEPVEKADLGINATCTEDLKLLCQNVSIFSLATVGKGLKSAEVNKMSDFLVTAKLSNGKPTKQSLHVECNLKRLACKSMTACSVEAVACGEYRVQYTPTLRGYHELCVTVNGRAVSGSPFPVFVSISPTELGKPAQVIPTFEYPLDVAINSKGEFIVASNNDICLLNRKWEKLRTYKKRNSSKRFRGIAVDTTDDHVYAITKTNATIDIVKLCPELKVIKQSKVYDKTSVSAPSGVEVVGDEVLVCDPEQNCVKVYTKDLEFKTEIGRDNGMTSVRGLSSDKAGNLYISDLDKNCVLVFSNPGSFLRSISIPHPLGLCVAGEHLYVTTGQHQVCVLLCTTGQQVASFGLRGSGEGEFINPYGMCVDKDGFLFVCDFSNHRVQAF